MDTFEWRRRYPRRGYRPIPVMKPLTEEEKALKEVEGKTTVIGPDRARPLSQVLADGFCVQRDNFKDYQGAVSHPWGQDSGMYLAPCGENGDGDTEAAEATRLHEYAHLNLITSGEQPLGIHAAFQAAGIDDKFLQAIADAKVMSHVMRKGLNLKRLRIFDPPLTEETRELLKGKITESPRAIQATTLLRSIGTDSADFVRESVSFSAKKKAAILAVFNEIDGIRTIEEWVRIGLEFQKEFETPKTKRTREEKAKEYEDAVSIEEPGEGSEDMSDADESPSETAPTEKVRKRKSKKEMQEETKKIARKVAEKFKAPEKREPAEDTGEKTTGERKKVSEEKSKGTRVEEKEKPLDVYEEKKEKTEQEKFVEEIIESLETLDQEVLAPHSSVFSSVPKTIQGIRDALDQQRSVKWGSMEVLLPRLEKGFEPKERSRKMKRSFVGPLRYPHRIVSDSAVFGSKLKGKGGTLIIDCSGSMGMTYAQVELILQKRPFATIAMYAADSFTLTRGYLTVIVDRGKRVTEAELKRVYGKFGTGNVVDGPALQWLCKRAGEKFWICDGIVTGQYDQTSFYLRAEAALLQKRYKVKRWASLNNFLDGKLPANA